MALSQAVAAVFLDIMAHNVYFAGLDVELLEGQFPQRSSVGKGSR